MDPRRLSTSANLLRLSTLGINFALTLFAGVFLGWLGQKIFHWGNWAILVGLGFGVVASYYTLFRDIRQLQATDKKEPPSP